MEKNQITKFMNILSPSVNDLIKAQKYKIQVLKGLVLVNLVPRNKRN